MKTNKCKFSKGDIVCFKHDDAQYLVEAVELYDNEWHILIDGYDQIIHEKYLSHVEPEKLSDKIDVTFINNKKNNVKSKKIYKEFTSANILGVTLEHTGFQGGDGGHGGFVKINVEDLGSTAMELNGEECDRFELLFRGDTERITFLSALKMIVEELENNPSV